jgi:KipI family sensor histidine kinase inhibitor
VPARLLPSGEGAVLVEVDSLDDALALHGWLTHAGRPAGLLDAVPGARTVLLVAEAPSALPAVRFAAKEALARLTSGALVDASAKRAGASTTPDPRAEDVEIVVRYDGEDLDEVARLTGLSVREVVTAHTGTPWVVGFAGFAPGFAYLVGGDRRLRVPRRDNPRTRVPTGSVGLADEFSGVYPRPSPAGWQLIGWTEATLWDERRDPPALLEPGMRVRFVDAEGAPGSVVTP